jgi:hypothetical protein
MVAAAHLPSRCAVVSSESRPSALATRVDAASMRCSRTCRSEKKRQLVMSGTERRRSWKCSDDAEEGLGQVGVAVAQCIPPAFGKVGR